MPNRILVMPRPNEKQHLALTEKHRYVGYGGARGGGKSWFVRWKATLLCLHYPGIKVLITRRTYKEQFPSISLPPTYSVTASMQLIVLVSAMQVTSMEDLPILPRAYSKPEWQLLRVV